MKGKKNNRKFKDLPLELIDNNNSTPKPSYETPLQNLKRLYPSIDPDVVETIYEQSRNLAKSKADLEMLVKSNKAEVEKVKEREELDKDLQRISEMELKEVMDKQKKEDEININFHYDERFVPKIEETDKSTPIPKNLMDYTCQQKASSGESLSMDKSNSNSSNKSSSSNNSTVQIDEFLFDYYIEVVTEVFPEVSRQVVIEKICEFEFNIDKLIFYLLNNESNESQTSTPLKKDDISLEGFDFMDVDYEDINSLMSNFCSQDLIQEFGVKNLTNLIKENNVQDKIENQIKKDKVVSKLSTEKIFLDKENFPALVEVNKVTSNNYEEENFLGKSLKEIQTPKIREDLKKLYLRYKFIDELEIQLVYYQYGDYFTTNKHFQNRTGVDPFTDKFLNSSQKIIVRENSNELPGNNSSQIVDPAKQQPQHIPNSNSKKLTNVLYEIISSKPNSWNFKGNDNIYTLDEYRDIRKKLIVQAKIAWQSQRFNDAKAILARANRYKEEINQLLNNRKIEVFSKNNNSILCNSNEAFIDLHGLNFDESLLIVRRKLNDIKLGNGTCKVLNIITGKGTHSVDKTPVLLNRLSNYFKSTSYNFKVSSDNGVIRVLF